MALTCADPHLYLQCPYTLFAASPLSFLPEVQGCLSYRSTGLRTGRTNGWFHWLRNNAGHVRRFRCLVQKQLLRKTCSEPRTNKSKY
eukprot:2591967-Amphidinium_carterae.1